MMRFFDYMIPGTARHGTARHGTAIVTAFVARGATRALYLAMTSRPALHLHRR